MRRHEPKVLRFDWVLVANAARARCLVRDPDNGALREVASFVHPASRLEGRQLGNDRPGHAFKGGASTQYEPHTEAHAKEHERFARELASHLEQAAQRRDFEHLALFASSAFLGVLREQLGSAAGERLQASIALDLTAYDGRELERRVSQALEAEAPGRGGAAG